MSQSNAATTKTGDTKTEEQKAPNSSSSSSSAAAAANNKNIKFTQLDTQKLKLVSDTVKRNPKSELAQSDILELVCYLEGELQARDVVIAALRSESIKGHLIAASQSQNKASNLNDPHAALFRDYVASSGNIASRQSSALVAKCEQESRNIANERLKFLDSMVLQQRQTHLQMCKILRNAESKEKQLVTELDEARRRHEHDTAQGDDITYGLEVERTRLRQDLEKEREAKKKLEKDLKKLQEQLEREKTREKQLVFFLLVERKKLVLKYIEERKRSEDYALILTEEKLKCDTLAEGLEEESKKSLRMEAELEKQSQAHAKERETLLANIASEQQLVREKDFEIKQLREQIEELKRSGPKTVTGKFISSPQTKSATGIAKSVVSSQSLRSANQISSLTSNKAAAITPPQPPLKKVGNPPPIPPNKPIVPVKRDSNSRIPFVTQVSSTNNNATTAATNVTSAPNNATGNPVEAVVAAFSSNITK
ncbi:CTTNBP2 N-terminal-like protein [Culicoides brevitarsis]|uniref:CTTNBP2 N-terminal-like protein n=1 Tax=Culicoides brevitarsis TaxID=469753 RepID=UPI00307B4518